MQYLGHYPHYDATLGTNQSWCKFFAANKILENVLSLRENMLFCDHYGCVQQIVSILI
jgi:hypothetical protein